MKISNDFSLSSPIKCIDEDGRVQDELMQSSNEKCLSNFDNLFISFLQQSKVLAQTSSSNNSSFAESIQFLNFARNEIDVILDLLGNLLDTKNLTFATIKDPTKLSHSDWLKKMKWNSKVKQESLQKINVNFSQFVLHIQKLQDENSAYFKQLQKLKHEDSCIFLTRTISGQSQLYIDYGFGSVGGKMEGLALIRPDLCCVENNSSDEVIANSTLFSVTVPFLHKKAKKLQIKVNGRCTASQKYSFDDYGKLLEREREIMLNLESFGLLKESFLANRINLFNCKDESFSISTQICSNLVVITVCLVENELFPMLYSKFDLFAIQLSLKKLAGNLKATE